MPYSGSERLDFVTGVRYTTKCVLPRRIANELAKALGVQVMTYQVTIANHRFAFGYYRQTFWNWLIGTAFFLGGLGGGLFLVSFWTGHTAGMVVGYLVVVVG